MKKAVLILILCLLLSFGTSIIASAEEYGVTPRYNNLNSCYTSFYIENNIAFAAVDVAGITNVTRKITVNILIEKRTLLGLVWKDEASWQSYTTDASKYFTFNTEVKSGTYRCNFEIIVEGINGVSETITDQITATN